MAPECALAETSQALQLSDSREEASSVFLGSRIGRQLTILPYSFDHEACESFSKKRGAKGEED